MKECPSCQFLVEDDLSECRYCGASLAAVPSGERPLPEPGEIEAPPVSARLVIGSVVAGLILVAGVGWWALGTGEDAPFTRDDDPAPTTTTVVQATTTTAALLGPTTPAGELTFDRYRSTERLSYNVELPAGAKFAGRSQFGLRSVSEGRGFRATYGEGRSIEVVESSLSGTVDAEVVKAYLQQAGYTVQSAKRVGHSAGPALELALQGPNATIKALMIEANRSLIVIVLSAPGGQRFDVTDAAVYQRAVSTFRVG